MEDWYAHLTENNPPKRVEIIELANVFCRILDPDITLEELELS